MAARHTDERRRKMRKTFEQAGAVFTRLPIKNPYFQIDFRSRSRKSRSRGENKISVDVLIGRVEIVVRVANIN